MDATLDRIKSELDLLTTDQQAEILQYLAHTLESETDREFDPEVAAAWEAEIERRVQEVLSGEEQGIPAEQVYAEMRAKYQ